MRFGWLLFSILMAGTLGWVGAQSAETQSLRQLPTTSATDRSTVPLTGTTHTLLYSYSGEHVGDTYGWIGKKLGDVTGDDVLDYIITAPYYTTQTLSGRAYVYSGADGSLVEVHTGVGIDLLGYSASDAGDVNGDGSADYIIGAPAGSYAVVYSGVTRTPLLTLTGVASAEFFGGSVANANDVNNDGYDDLFVGASLADAGATLTNTGRVYMLSGLDGSILWQQDGEQIAARLGDGAGLVGDVNNDSVPDVVATARGHNNNNGRGYVYSGDDGTLLYTLEPTAPFSQSFTFGQFFSSGGFDVNMDGINDIYVGDYAALNGDGRVYIYSGADGSIIHQLEAFTSGGAICCGGLMPDQDGDGHAEIVVASYTSNAGTSLGGRMDVVSGKTGLPIHTIFGNDAGNLLGVDAQWIGDINGDGFPEFLGTASGYDFFGTGVGNAYVFNFVQRNYLPIIFE